MYIGYLMRQEKLLAKGVPWHLAGLSLICFLCLHTMNDAQIAIGYNWYPHGLMDLALTWLIGYVAMFLATALDEAEGTFIDVLCWVGRYSFLICCIHHVEKNALPLQRMMAHAIPHSALLGYASLFLVRMLLYVIIVNLFLRYDNKRPSRI